MDNGLVRRVSIVSLTAHAGILLAGRHALRSVRGQLGLSVAPAELEIGMLLAVSVLRALRLPEFSAQRAGLHVVRPTTLTEANDALARLHQHLVASGERFLGFDTEFDSRREGDTIVTTMVAVQIAVGDTVLVLDLPLLR